MLEQHPITVPIVSNISIIENEIINIIEVIIDLSGNLNPPLNSDKNTVFFPLKKLEIFSQNFQLIPGVLPVKTWVSATPRGIANIVAATIPIITEPLTL